jgi:hypothetical protein
LSDDTRDSTPDPRGSRLARGDDPAPGDLREHVRERVEQARRDRKRQKTAVEQLRVADLLKVRADAPVLETLERIIEEERARWVGILDAASEPRALYQAQGARAALLDLKKQLAKAESLALDGGQS